MYYAEGESAGYLGQRLHQLEAVQRPLDKFIKQWELDQGVNPIATSLYLNRELHIFSDSCSEPASLLFKVRPLFPGSLSQHDVIVDSAGTLSGDLITRSNYARCIIYTTAYFCKA